MKKVIISLIVAIVAITSSTAYAYSNGLVKTNEKELFNIHYKNVNTSSENGKVYLEGNNDIYFECDLKRPGDTFEFTVDMVNDSNKKAKVDEKYITELTDKQQRYLKYTVTYADGTEIKKDDILNSNETRTLKVKVEFLFDITEEDLPTEKENLDLSFNITMVEA